MDDLLHLPWGYVATILLTMGGYLLAFVLIPRILLDRRGPEATLAWILIIVFVPYLGAAIFYLIGRTRVQRRARKARLARYFLHDRLERLPEASREAETLPALPIEVASDGLAVLTRQLVGTAPAPGNAVEVFIDGDRAYDLMEEAVTSAENHVNMMSYIYRDDQAGVRFRDLLAEKARAGVKVRLLVDGFGGYEIGSSFMRSLLRAGGHFAHFAPVFGGWGRWRPNLRNHRKILVVDGRVGFTGGLNIGEEYQGRRASLAPWRDTHLRIEGPAVRNLQEVFIEDWFFATDEDLAEPDCFPELTPTGPELVQVVSSGPDHDYATIHRVLFAAINQAEKRIFITTPYFVPDPAMLLALKSAAWRGIEVVVLVPGRSDMRLAQLAGRSYYEELLVAGVRIYEYAPGVLHAKTMVIDGKWSTVGSANMDVRSFQLNFEVNVLVWGPHLANRLEEIFQADVAQADPIRLHEFAYRPRYKRLAENVCRVLSPVL